MELTDKRPIAKDPDKLTTVYAAQLNGMNVCVKEQVFAGLSEANAAMNEALLQCRVKHPYVCEVYSTYLDPLPHGRVKSLILMELLDYDLNKAIKTRVKANRPWSTSEVWTILSGLIDALAKAQKDGISHRDIKPANLLCTKDSSLIKLGDFGCAKWSPGLVSYHTRHTVTGTPLFFSPELTQSFAQYLLTGDARQEFNPVKADVYALGVCVIYMLGLNANLAAYTGMGCNQTLLAFLRGLNVDETLKRTVEAMIAADQEVRPDFVSLQSGLNAEIREVTEEEEKTDEGQSTISFSDIGVLLVEVSRERETITTRVLRNEEEREELKFDDTFERDDLEDSQVIRLPSPSLDSTLFRAYCIVCGTAQIAFDIEDSSARLSLSNVCSQACFTQLQSSAPCLFCQKPRCGKEKIQLPCDPMHFFCSKGCFLTFLAEKTGHFQKKPAITCPGCNTETTYDFIFAEVGGKAAFHRLAFSIRPCQICSRLKSYYQLPCRRHWLCVEHFELGSQRKFLCEECDPPLS